MRFGPNVSPARRRLLRAASNEPIVGAACCATCAAPSPIGVAAGRRPVRMSTRLRLPKASPKLRIGQTSSSSSSSQPGATTQNTTSIVWTPSDATQFASQTDQLWQALNSAVVSCSTGQTGTATTTTSTSSSGTGLAAAQVAQFQEDYIAWEAFYQKAQNADASSLFGDSFQGLWWNTDTISQFQGKAAAWYNIIQAACPNQTLPTLSPPTPGSFLSNLFPPSADTVKALTTAAVVGVGLWFAWPWLAALRKR